MNTTTTHDFCGISSGAETTTDYSDFTKHQSVVGEIRDIGKQMNDSINKSGLGCRWWMLLKDTPYTKGDVNLAGWNSKADYNRGKMAFNTTTPQRIAMVHFPDAIFNHITSYILDPDFYKKYQKKHAEVWQKIHPLRWQYQYDGNGANPNGPRIDIHYDVLWNNGKGSIWKPGGHYSKRCSMYPHSDICGAYAGRCIVN